MTEFFKYTTDGYNEAVEYLKSIGKWEEAKKGQSDGWSIVLLANDIKRSTHTGNTEPIEFKILF